MKSFNVLVLITLCLLVSAAPVRAQSTAFTYQGHLIDGGNPANGLYDLQIVLFDAASGGSALGTNTLPAAPVTNGLYNVTLDFGANFSGPDRWLEIGVRANSGPGSYTILSPRQ